jgi:DNA modification methylase
MGVQRIVEFDDGMAICASSPECFGNLRRQFPLVIADPPYGGILDEAWDKVDAETLAKQLTELMTALESVCLPGSAAYVFGGIGTPRNRPFYRFLSTVEDKTGWELAGHITWAKKRAYGVQNNYLFTREEIAYFVLGCAKAPRKFVVPLLSQKRGYPGYNKAHPAKSEYLRRTNVWTDITELLRGKVHPAEKPTALAEVMISIHTEPDEYVLDPFAGSGSTALACRNLGRKFVVIERDEGIFEKMVERLTCKPQVKP